jgi:hypothetical protein
VHAAGVGESEPQSTAGDGQGCDTDAEYSVPQVELLLSYRGILESLARVSRRDERGLSPPDRPHSIAVPPAPTGGPGNSGWNASVPTTPNHTNTASASPVLGLRTSMSTMPGR